MADRTFDVVVLGAGPAGENAAGRAADNGLSVAIVESELVGGECSYWGCIPSKLLLRPGDVLAAAARVPGAAQAVTGSIDTGSVFGRRDQFVGHYDDTGAVPWLDGKGITLVRGSGRLAGVRTVEVTGGDEDARLTAERGVVIATGTDAAIPPVPGLDGVRPWDNRGATAASAVPERLLVLGGGTIGVEMAQAFRRLGSAEVTVVEGGPQLLGREEPFAGAEVRSALAAEGVSVLTGARVTAAERDGVSGEVRLVLADGTRLTGTEILVAAGRRARTHGIGLETVGLTPGRAVDVDDRMRVLGVPGEWLYAVGDVTGLAPLTHIGKYQGRIAGDVLAGRDARDRASRDVVPRVTFTDPQVSAVGLTEAQARERLPRVRAVRYATGTVAGASLAADSYPGTSQLVVDEERRVLVGATFTGAATADLLHSATVAIAGRVALDDLWHAVPSFPTVSEVWLRLLEAYGL